MVLQLRQIEYRTKQCAVSMWKKRISDQKLLLVLPCSQLNVLDLVKTNLLSSLEAPLQHKTFLLPGESFSTL